MHEYTLGKHEWQQRLHYVTYAAEEQNPRFLEWEEWVERKELQGVNMGVCGWVSVNDAKYNKGQMEEENKYFELEKVAANYNE